MRTITFLALFVFAQCAHALGPEEQEFVGVIGKRIVALKFLDDPNFYGAKIPRLSRCADEWVDDRGRLTCNADREGDSRVVYVMAEKKPSRIFKEARQLYKRLYPRGKVGIWNEKGVYSDDFYVCTRGCSKADPKFFVLITHGD